MPTVQEYQSFVKAGAALLDERKPGWAELIDLDTLNVHAYSKCVLAQVYESKAGIAENGDEFYNAGFSIGMDALFGRGRTWQETITYGFDRSSYDTIDLNPLWHDEVNERLTA